MGHEAEDQEIETEELEVTLEEGQETEQTQEEGEEAGEVEIVLEGETHTQEQKPKGFQRRVRRFNRRLQEKDDRIAELEGQLANRVPQSVSEMPLPPTEESVGYDTEKYQQAMAQYRQDFQNWQANQLNAAIQTRETGLQQQQAKRSVDKALSSYYDDASKLGVDGFDEAEDSVIDVLGGDVLKEIIPRFKDKAPAAVFFLSKNEDKLFELKEALDSDPVEATMLIGALRDRLKVQRKTKSQAPEPDTELKGGKVPTKPSALQRELDRAREQAGQTGDISEVLKIKKEAKAQGIDLE